ncbi:hypothetical protein [Alkalicoccobacillus porphyridii]|uniref:Uncharacterized protein n=1 Tax=Alkalicoccobacillus porphyridii TaxID=2597270 RepID=A0A554A4C8_9BACI|nr:hypothetical protein [Alkalicoccobacillus porphyridii]TSB48526.1 hypothetical protein FN960_02950 [Alkalicoccobacillus porphyridii]
MLDFFNPWVGSYTFQFDSEDFRERLQSTMTAVRDQMDTGNEAIHYAIKTLSEQEGKFIDEAEKALHLLYTHGQGNEILTSAQAMNHIHSFEHYLNKQSKQKYDIHKELDMAAVELLGRRSHF